MVESDDDGVEGGPSDAHRCRGAASDHVRSSPRAAIRRRTRSRPRGPTAAARDLRGAGLGRRGERADIGVAGQVDWGGRRRSRPAKAGQLRHRQQFQDPAGNRAGRWECRSVAIRIATDRAPQGRGGETPVITNAANSQTSSTTWATPTTAPPAMSSGRSG